MDHTCCLIEKHVTLKSPELQRRESGGEARGHTEHTALLTGAIVAEGYYGMTCVDVGMESLMTVLCGSKPWGPMSAEPLPFPVVPRDSPPQSPAAAPRPAPRPRILLTQCPKRSLTDFVSSSQQDGAPCRLRTGTAERFRRHSVDGSSLGQDGGAGDNRRPGADKRFHPYSRRCSDGAPPAVPAYCYLQECPASDALGPALIGSVQSEGPCPWTPLSTRGQSSMFMEQSSAEELSGCALSAHGTPSTVSSLPLQFPAEYSTAGPEESPYYSFPSVSSRPCQDSAGQQLYPKPIYSYSILIFMALRNSRTGSLPVSEIYSFMTEHFPYFKTAPDGWKNSVRHNLSLNKCFEKVENKNGSSARKGCLWALNPAKVEKMQEELQKWRRKDPVTVRRSMARPEELDHLLGERSEKLKVFSTHLTNQTHLRFHRGIQGPSCSPAHALSLPQPSHHSLPAHLHLPSTPHAFSFYPPITQQPSTHLPPRVGSLDSPLPAHTPPSYGAALQASHGAAGSMQELLMEAEMSNDIDTLNPSLTDLQLHGHLWEELRKDSLAPDTLLLMDASGQLSHAGDFSMAGPGGPDADPLVAFPDLHVSSELCISRSEAGPEQPTLPLL
ncbi:forkhead box protein N1 [Brachyhypopomus gauderio]|uniref:forkhead box protein N1 n=1 Tax=Brachyhypopomus gauderio TaxID=698409 RepID=UPI004041D182